MRISSKQWVVLLLPQCALMGLLLIALSPAERSRAAPDTEAFPDRFKLLGEEYNAYRARYQNLTYPELRDRLGPQPAYRERLPFDPTQARYFDLVKLRLQFTEEERDLFARNGFVSIDQGRALSFPAAYQQVYTSDLPVLITTDSILHALHRSYDDVLKELEETYFHWTIETVLSNCQVALANHAATAPGTLNDNLRDVDLYLGVARKLLQTTPPESVGSYSRRERLPGREEAENQERLSYSVLGQDAAIDAVITAIDSLRSHSPASGEAPEIYGSERFVDYSQFKPRGHYTESAELAAYFRCLMWLGRADCGWNVLPTDPSNGRVIDSRRELRNAVLITELLAESGSLQQLRELDRVLEFLVGRSDNFDASRLSDLLQSLKVTSVRELLQVDVAERLEQAIALGRHGEQLIRSQTLNPASGPEPTKPPVIFQLFGQRFVIDSFILSRVVYDEINYQGEKVPRHRPTALDVMAALGNDEAVDLLADELKTWQYSANLLACHNVVDQLASGFWNESLHHMWVDSLRSLDTDLTVEPHAPAALQTRVWQRKQLQTQLASWAELRRDNILYAKQSFGVPGCAFPCGYVEPYPELYAKLKSLADTAGPMLGALSPVSADDGRLAVLQQCTARQVAFFAEMSATMGMLEQIARGELRGESQSDVQRDFLRGTFDNSGRLKYGSSRIPDFSGWYCRLFYARHKDPTGWNPMEQKAVVADVHTNPNDDNVLEVATGDVRLLVMAIDGATEPTVYVGPAYSYYEFWQPAEQRLNDMEWRRQLAQSAAPPGPDWVKAFTASTVARRPEEPRVTVTRLADQAELFVSSVSGLESSNDSVPLSARGLPRLAQHRNIHSLDLSKSDIDNQALRSLSGLPDLRSLDLSETKITDDGVAVLTEHRNLQSLDLSKTAVTSAALPALVKLPYLSQLDLRGTQITEAAVLELRRKMPHTEVQH